MIMLPNPLAAPVPTGSAVHAAGQEPLPGYRLLEPLGAGGFGEVWKCEVPGGLCKAIKFVGGNLNQLDGDNAARQELHAQQRLKAVRHPFILSLERVEVIGGELMIVMELADRNLDDVAHECRDQGLPGIPREALLAFLLEAAEALDYLNFQHQLQHLDVKPRNLFVVSNHVKVADFGLVHSLGEICGGTAQLQAGVTPQYAAPEVYRGTFSRHSDQYSLAIVYMELLTGMLPIEGRNARQLMMGHLQASPNLEPLPPGDRAAVGRALEKDPERRFRSCLEFVSALLGGATLSSGGGAAGQLCTLLMAPLLRSLSAQAPQSDDLKATPKPSTDTLSETVLDDPAEPIPGYRVVQLLQSTPLAEVWKVRDNVGAERLAQHLCAAAGSHAGLASRLQGLRHPNLVPLEVVICGGSRVAVLSELCHRTLRTRFQECFSQGLPGIPRAELLNYLRPAAEVLDHFAARQLYHLGLRPHNLVLAAQRVRVADFGLLHLAWAPMGQPVGPLNPRYAAPELHRPGVGAAADQYSLALIFAELVTGVHPLHSRGSRRDGRPGAPDLDALTALDRAIVARALDADPARRFARCGDFVRALEDAIEDAIEARDENRQEKFSELPVVARCGTADDPPGAGPLPAVSELVDQVLIAAAGARRLEECQNFRYLVCRGNVLEHRCLVRAFSGALKLRVNGFRVQWRGELVTQDPTTFVCRIAAPQTLWQQWVGKPPWGLEVSVRLQPDPCDGQLFRANLRVAQWNPNTDTPRLVAEVGPAVLHSLRTYLQVEVRPRLLQRWPFAQPVHLVPVLPDLGFGTPIEAQAIDLSQAGISLLAPAELPVGLAYVQLLPTPPLGDLAVLARLACGRKRSDGFEVEAAFVGAAREAEYNVPAAPAVRDTL